MPVYEQIIDGVVKDWLPNSFRPSLIANGKDVWQCQVFSKDRAYDPPLGAEATVTEDGVLLLGGFLDKKDENGGNQEPIKDVVYTLSFVGYDTLATRRVVTETFAAGTTLKAILQTLFTNYLDVYPGVTFNPTQINGPSLPSELKIKNVVLSVLLDDLSTWSGLTWKIGADKVFGMYAAGGPAPFDITDTDSPPNTAGEITTHKSGRVTPNVVIVNGGTFASLTITKQFVGDGVTSTFTLPQFITGWYPSVAPYDGAVGYGVVHHLGTESLGGLNSPAGFIWEYDHVNKTITRRSGPPANGVAFSIMFDAQGPFRVEAIDSASVAANGPWEVMREYPEIVDTEVLQEIADALLLELQEEKDEVVYNTYNPGMRVGQLQNIECDDRNVDGQYLITEVRGVSFEGHIRWTVRGVLGNRFRGSFRDTYRDWLKMGKGSTGVTIPAALPTPGLTVGPAPPEGAIQYYKQGNFGGHAGWTFTEAEILAKLFGIDAGIWLRGQIGGINFGVPNVPAALAVRIGTVTTSRLYLSNQAAGYTPTTFKGAWDDTTQAVTKKLTFNKPDLTNLHAQFTETNTNNEWDGPNYRGVSDGLVAQTISGTLNGILPATAGPFANHAMFWHIHMYATIGDSDSVRHTFINDYRENSPSSPFPINAAWGGFALGPISITSGAIQAGDRLVIEIGTVARNSSSTSFNSKVAYGARSDRNDASIGSAIDTSSWLDLNIAQAGSTLVAQAWSNVIAGDDDALTLEILADGKAYFKNVNGIYFNGLTIGGGGAAGTLTILTADPSSPVNDSEWTMRTGTSPNMMIHHKVRIAGVTHTVWSFGPI